MGGTTDPDASAAGTPSGPGGSRPKKEISVAPRLGEDLSGEARGH